MATILNNSINWGLDQPLNTQYFDSPNLDAFSRLRVSNLHPVGLFDCQYDLQSLLYEQLINGAGATIAHDSTNRNALMTFSSTPSGGYTYMQSYQYIRYQPGKSQLGLVTFNFNGGVANVIKSAGLSDGTNGFEFRANGTTLQFALLTASSHGNTIVDQTNWNLDKLDGTGKSGITLDVSKTQILVLDFQCLYVGRVRMGFDINGVIVYAHEFLHANVATYPYIQSANLPIRVGMIASGTVSTTMAFVCSAVASEGGKDRTPSYTFTTINSITAANGTDTYLFAVRPKLLFNSIANRIKFQLQSISINVTGNASALIKLKLGQVITTPTYTDANTTYSGFEVDTAGSLSGAAAIVVDSFYASAQRTATSLYSLQESILRYPITLDAAGAHRDLGTLVFTAQGLGANVAMDAAITWSEER
jgi:hypothetical protein